MEIKKENWFFCVLCDTVSYKFDCCGNISCSGGGCDKCKELNTEIWKIVNEGKAPSKDEVPHCDDGMVVEELEKRKIQLVAREGVLGELLENNDFPTDGHHKVIQLLYDETLTEMYRLGLTEEE